MEIITFWNNKGGTGKTSISFQVICAYANANPDKKILAIDVCPQANLSELFLGGLEGKGGDNLLKVQGSFRATLGGYFEKRMSIPFEKPDFANMPLADFITIPVKYNANIPSNINLLCGDPILELQSNAVSTLANTQIPGVNTWIRVIDWIKDLISSSNEYDICFVDTNPSFSIYTQMSIAASNKLILPVMADDSSRRAIMNAFSLIYSLKLPSEIYTAYAFKTKLENESRPLPKIHLIVKNRITQYMTDASAYNAVLVSIESEISNLMNNQMKDNFTFSNIEDGVVSIRDFQTTGVVAFARGCPFYLLKSGYLTIQGKRIQVTAANIALMRDSINEIVAKI